MKEIIKGIYTKKEGIEFTVRLDGLDLWRKFVKWEESAQVRQSVSDEQEKFAIEEAEKYSARLSDERFRLS